MSEPEIWTPQHHRETRFSREVALDVEPHPTKHRVLPDGRKMGESTIKLTLEAAERMWQGYACARCLEGTMADFPLPERNPEACPTCGFPIRRLQRQMLERDFKGVDPTDVGSFPMDREMEYLERTHHAQGASISVSKQIKEK